ncbi:MAG: radical SAM protein [bacterium]
MSSPPVYLVTQGSLSEATWKNEPPPIGVLYIGAALKKAGYRVRLFHLQEDRMNPVKKAVQEEKPLLVGFSNFVSPLLKYDIELSRWLQTQGVKVVWGGVFATSLPRIPLQSGLVDYVAIGEGEKLIVELARAVREGSDPEGIPGVGYCKDEEIVINPPAPPDSDIDKFEFGMDMIDWEKYILKLEGGERYARIPFSRGCPFRCSFCYNCADPGRQKWRGHGPEYMKDMISFLKEKYRADLFFFVCDNPFGKVEKGKEVIESLGVTWAGTCHLKTLSPDFIDWALETGCRRLGLGLESGSDRILSAMNKGFTKNEVRERMGWCRDKGLNTISNWMAMVPGETTEDLQETFRLMAELHETSPRNSLTFSIFRAYPGTRFFEEALQLGHYEPKNLEEWADYKAEINRLLGFSDRKVNRMQLLASGLFRKPAGRNPRWSRPLRRVLTKRLTRARFRGPLEDSFQASIRVYRKMKNAAGRT